MTGAAIVGIAEGGHSAGGRSPLQLLTEASLDALDDAGLSLLDVDGLAVTGLSSKMEASTVAEYLGIQPRWIDGGNSGGASFGIFVANAARAIAAGDAQTVLICYGSDQRSAQRRKLSSAEAVGLPIDVHEVPYGPLLPISAYALAATRHMHEYGSTPEQLAEIAVAAREWALLNPDAYRYGAGPLTVADVRASKRVSSPLTVLDCCLVTDGSGAIVLTSAERARDLRKPPALVLGTGMASTHRGISQATSLLDTGARLSGEAAFAAAGLGPQDMDVVEIYDSFTITVALSLEGLGFCAPGEGPAFAAGGRLAPGGARPINTNGGGLSCMHPGMYGLFLLIESVRQLRGEAGARQLARAETAVAHATGAYLNTHSTVVLGVDR